MATITNTNVLKELERNRNGYCVNHVSGIPTPGFLHALLAAAPASVRFRFSAWILRVAPDWQAALFYLEARYRITGKAGSKELTEWHKQFKSPDAEFVA